MGPIRRSKSKNKTTTTTAAGISQPLSQPSDWWHDFSSKFHESLKDSTDSQSFESMFKMSMKTFGYIASLVQDYMMSKNSNFIDMNGNPLNLYDMVAVSIRRLSSGEPLSAVGSSLNIHKTTVTQLTKRFVDALEVQACCHIHWPSTEPEMEDVKLKFEKIGGFPNCCGAIDTTHILMCLPNVERTTNVWIDREKNQTMTLQAIVDADLRFHDITAGFPGCSTDENIHKMSEFYKWCKEGEYLNGKRKEISEGSEIDEYIVGHSGFPLLKWLLTPYRGDTLCDSEMKFNKMLSKTQQIAKEAFVKLKENWKILKIKLWRPDKHRLPKIILACCILHNILIDMEDEVQEKLDFSNMRDLDYRKVFCDADDDQDGSVLREKISVYLSGISTP